MSILFGVRKSVEKQAQLGELERLAQATAKYALDGIEMKVTGRLGMAVQPYYTHRRSRLGNMMAEDQMGNRISLDGRLDNVEGLCEELHIRSENVSDSEIVLQSFLAYGEAAFSRFVGDWAVVLWHEQEQELYLARDHAGTRTLYYEVTKDGVLWGTYLESFFANGQQRNLNHSYIAAFLCSQLSHLATPYENIEVVPPAHFVAINETGVQRTKAHWSWMIGEFLQYKTDTQYEEQFLHLFRQAVERRTEHDDLPILAELSGGMDSSSIVCMSDTIRRSNGAMPEQLVDTVSYYDPDDPHWNEMPFVACVEEQRGKIGTHLHSRIFSSELSLAEIPSFLPGMTAENVKTHARMEEEIGARGHRVLLSGIGGDELLGGVPTGLPELADQLSRCEFGQFLTRSTEWCLPSRTPILHMTRDTVRYMASLYSRSVVRGENARMPPGHTDRLQRALGGHRKRISFVDRRPWISPSRIENGLSWWKLLETLPHLRPRFQVRREYRYPFLDRNLVEYLLRIPRRQLVKPGRRRAMMRRVMVGVVPVDILERKRKAYRSRAVLPYFSAGASRLRDILKSSFLVEHNFLNYAGLDEALMSLEALESQWLPEMVRVILFEFWIQEQSIASGHGLKEPQTFVAHD